MTKPPAYPIDDLRQAVLDLMQEHSVPGLSIAVVDGQETVWSEGFGHTDLAKTHPVTPETPSSLQSTGKTYTATGFLIAVAEGKARLDDRLRDVYPEFEVRSRFGDDEADGITFRQLLSHQAGLGHEAPVGSNHDFRPCTFEEHIKSIGETWLHFPVGTEQRYSNLGMDLAAYALERLYEMPFGKYMRSHLLDPLGMTHSSYSLEELKRLGPTAQGHAEGHEATSIVVPMLGAGGLYASVNDMARFISFHLNAGSVDGKEIIPPELLEEMYRPQAPWDSAEFGYGLGIARSQRFGTTLLEHGGGGYGYGCHQSWAPEHQIGVAILINQDASNVPIGALLDLALRRMIEAKGGGLPPEPSTDPTPKESILLEPAKASSFAGVYRGRSTLSIREKEGTLYVGETALTARSEDIFETPGGWTARFEEGEGDVPRSLFLAFPGFGMTQLFHYDHGPQDPEGSAEDHWHPHVGVYWTWGSGGISPSASFIRNGHLFLDAFGEPMRLRPYHGNLFFSVAGEPAEFEEEALIFSGITMKRLHTPAAHVRDLIDGDPSSVWLRGETLEELARLLDLIGEDKEANEVRSLAAQLSRESD